MNYISEAISYRIPPENSIKSRAPASSVIPSKPVPMASPCTSHFLLATIAALIGIAGADTAAAPAGAGPANLTGILSKGGQYDTLMRLLGSTQVGEQIQSQLNNSFNGLTIFAPTDNAFNALKAGTLNALNSQEQVNLLLYHVMPRYYSMSTFETASNPLTTQASGPSGVYTINVSSNSNQVNVSTGIVDTQLNNALYADFPLAVYSVEKVLLPSEIFAPKPPSPEPVAPPANSPGKPNKRDSSPAPLTGVPSLKNHPSAAATAAAVWIVAVIVGFAHLFVAAV